MRLNLPGRAVGVRQYGRTGAGAAGATETVVLLHAFPLDARMWEAAIAELRLDADLCTLDFPGLGESFGRFATIDDAADDVVALLDHLHVERAIACGVSMGGYVALSLAARHGARLGGLLLADTRATADSDEQRAVRDGAIARVAREGVGGYVGELVPRLCAPSSKQAREVAIAIGGLQDPLGVAGALAALRDRPDRSGMLATITVPTTVVVGSEDALTPPEEARRLSQAIPGAELVELVGVGHLSPLEAPARFAEAVRGLLGRVARGR